jgi:NAD(P)-dependent dehydrogenase (short-subunit alcohol dehydrogenase family)
MRLKGKTAVITGASSGIGAACARLFVTEGAQVCIIDRSIHEAERFCAEFASSAFALQADVTAEDQVRLAFSECGARMGRIDALIHSAGVAVRQPIATTSDDEWQRVLDVNLRGAFLCSKYGLGYMLKGSCILHVASVVGITGMRNRAAYSASKGGLVALTRNMAMDYAPRGIRVNCICPGFVRTPFTASLFADAERRSSLTALHPLGRLGEPDDVAAAALFLASDEAAWITGVVLPVDGGFSAGHGVDV